ncbi:FYVE, RhoGEF and PH domain-containing protein 6-like isoform X2 [Acanthopagrus latus]|uniref:FYVE, RhoGEF and PH domain-containing protein 6-like isoform X2 n=1 Tax=Acanthopagrus latus TaxID=8177 RepID=UPI00187D0011|nr:FYVE, RhoGEF and PH domain-containing protein 6-like isoform X2 [Acanthopagrus latus]
MMNSGMHKPPLAPKPKLTQPQRPGLSPSTPRRGGVLSLASPGTPRRDKPVLAPKPCLSKLSTAVESKPLASKSLHQTSVTESPRTKGLLNSHNGIQQENKKPDWDYIIPICLCSHENCVCIRNTSLKLDKTERDLLHRGKNEENKKLLPPSRDTLDNSGDKTITNNKPLRETFALDKNLNTDVNMATFRPSLPHRTWSDEANGNVIPHSAPWRGPEEDALGSEHKSCVPQPSAAAPRKPVPVPVPRKPRMAVLTRQEKVEEGEGEEVTSQEGRDVNAKEVRVPSGAEKQPITLSARKACPMPAPPPRKKPLLSAPEKAPTSAPRALAEDVEEEDLGWDSSSNEMEVSADKEDEEVEVEKEGTRDRDQEDVYTDFSHSPPPISQPPDVTVAAEGVVVKVAPKKPQRHSSPMAWMQKKESFEGKDEGKKLDNERRPTADCVSKDRLMRELPAPPAEKESRNVLTVGALKPSQSSKQRAKSFTAADLIRSDGQKRNSFRKLLDLKLSVKMLPKLMAKGGGQSPDRGPDGHEHSTDRDQDVCQKSEHLRAGRKLSCPLIGVEQSVDGEEISYYENVPHYEEIPDYMNVQAGTDLTSPPAAFSPQTAWQSSLYSDEGIYEEQEPYMSFEKNSGQQQQSETPADCESSVDEEVAPLDDGPSDDDIVASTSDEEEDSSSVSSKGEPELPAESPSGQKKSKIQHIATEIMSSESVFVDVLKLLHVDFRDAVSQASRQSGKPVIEERLLNQILYSLPQLYELNQDLLRELKQRVAKWEEHAQLADIFLKKGPYLKMYSTYIREYDKNVATLEEQSKKNPAFGAVVREFEASPRCANLALRHYLLKPVQRIPQYQLLLTDYLKNLSEDSEDYKDTQAALVIVKEVANHANDIMKQGDNFQKLIQVQCSLNGQHEIVQPGRIFLKEGILKKLSRKVMQPRMFFLFNDTLLYTTPVQSGQYKFNNMLSLAGMKVSKPSQEAYQNELNIESVERSFILSASSAAERDNWLEAISTAISDYTKKKISFIPGKSLEEVELNYCDDGAPLGSKAPIWIPDPRATMCMICTCEFTLTWRRHHCRACGKVVCQSCSSNKHQLEYLKNQLARVCDQCVLVLQQQKSEQALSAAVSPGNRATFAFSRKQKKIPAALKEVSANTDSSMSGYLQRSKGNKKQGKRLWFVIKDKVLYTYAASEDVAALESQPLLGFMLKVDSSQKLQFKLYHKNTPYYIFKADDVQTAQRWIDSFKEATVL